MESADFARLYLRACELHEASWNGHQYAKQHTQCANEACKEKSLSPSWGFVLTMLMNSCYNDAEMWAHERLAPLQMLDLGKYEDQNRG